MEFKVWDRVRYAPGTKACAFSGDAIVLQYARSKTHSGFVVYAATLAGSDVRWCKAEDLLLIARPIYVTPEQIAALSGCIDAAENDGYLAEEVTLAREALAEVNS